MLNRYFVVDDFYDDPDRLVEAALSSARDRAVRGSYAGVMTHDAFLTTDHREFFETLLQESRLESATAMNGKIRFTRIGDPCTQHIHFDGGLDTLWAGVIYLSRQHPSVEGTTFWRHRRTTLEEAPRRTEQLARLGWRREEDPQRFLETEGLDEACWEKTLVIPFKYNRLILFRPWLFHAAGPAFGNSLESSRIVQTFFLGH